MNKEAGKPVQELAGHTTDADNKIMQSQYSEVKAQGWVRGACLVSIEILC